MFDVLEIFVRVFAVALPVWVMAILALGAVRAGLSGFRMAQAVIWTALIGGAWFAASVPLSQIGAFRVPDSFAEPPLVIGFLIGGAALVWALARLTSTGRQITDAAPLSAIASVQIARVMGGLFLIGCLMGRVPPEFAIPAGLGDIWAAISGYQATRALAAGAPDARRKLARANTIGLADFALAVVLGVMTSEGMFHILSKDATNIINDYPLALFPAYFVPIFMGFHFIAISRLRAERKERAQLLSLQGQ
ncbi:hypothetical protein SAMN05421759_1248 [Roseivivax lentus]|uniref:Uncharacterized protein n=1 Tax=Roseivivax lentus TaxID=633194 RepID=A0A1N7Q0M7_9RHOB|nr:hypothetical protein [Roseivivax lentus]SIT16443.1 hypothetical protein SAMN05421759_1248 [Roseivivax lentus]